MNEKKQFKVGQKWLTRDSREATIFGVSNNGTIGIDLDGQCYLADCDGMRYKHQIHSYDLVRLLETQPIQPSPGYRLLLPDEPVDRSADSKHQCLDKCDYLIRWVDVGTGPHTTKQTETFYYQCPIEPGEGWRFLDDDEPLHEYDEVYSHSKKWCGIGITKCKGKGEVFRRRIEPKYRPFANAAEFKPHRDRWWKYKGDGTYVRPPVAYSDGSHGGRSWLDRFKESEFDDGTPFGVEAERKGE